MQVVKALRKSCGLLGKAEEQVSCPKCNVLHAEQEICLGCYGHRDKGHLICLKEKM